MELRPFLSIKKDGADVSEAKRFLKGGSTDLKFLSWMFGKILGKLVMNE